MKKEIVLCKFDINESLFDTIINSMGDYVIKVDNIENYFKGCHDKLNIYYDGNSCAVLQECLLRYFANDNEPVSDWKQCIIRKTPNQTNLIVKGVDGSRAWTYMSAMLKKYYTSKEFDERLKMFQSDYDANKIQIHYQYMEDDTLNIVKFDDCVKYDINGAHNDALIEIFPKAKELLMMLYNRRKEIPIYKAYVNYFVGMLCRKGYRKTYNWIVQRTTAKLSSAIDFVGGELLYANTDGFMVSKPQNKLSTSMNLGDFKLEYEGTSYIYSGDNYWCYQITKNGKKDITGNILYSVRDLIDLEKNTVVKYDRRVNIENNTVYADNIEVIKNG